MQGFARTTQAKVPPAPGVQVSCLPLAMFQTDHDRPWLFLTLLLQSARAPDGFLSAVEGGVPALVREALPSDAKESSISVAFALTGFPVWSELQRQKLPRDTFFALWTRLVGTGMAAV